MHSIPMRYYRASVCLGLLAVMIAAPVFSSDVAAAEPEETIVVEGQVLTREEQRSLATGFVRSTQVARGELSIARWTRPVCPSVKGLSDEHARIVERKVRAIAKAVDAPVSEGKCKANLLIAFVDDGQDLVQRMVKKRPLLTYQMNGPDRHALREGDAPIRWWYGISFSNDGINEAFSVQSPVTGGNAEGGGSVLPDGIPVGSSHSASLIRTQATRIFTTATVVIDVNRAEGVSLAAAAAYAAFVGLAEVSRTVDPPTKSILSLFEGSAGATQLTAWDNSFLKALYAMPMDRSGRYQRSKLIKVLMDDLREGNEG